MIRTVRIVCSGDHVLASAWYDGDKCSAAHALETFSKVYAYAENERVRCQTCGCSSLHYEDLPTPHATLQDGVQEGSLPPSLFLLATVDHAMKEAAA